MTSLAWRQRRSLALSPGDAEVGTGPSPAPSPVSAARLPRARRGDAPQPRVDANASRRRSGGLATIDHRPQRDTDGSAAHQAMAGKPAGNPGGDRIAPGRRRRTRGRAQFPARTSRPPWGDARPAAIDGARQHGASVTTRPGRRGAHAQSTPAAKGEDHRPAFGAPSRARGTAGALSGYPRASR